MRVPFMARFISFTHFLFVLIYICQSNWTSTCCDDLHASGTQRAKQSSLSEAGDSVMPEMSVRR